VISTRSPARTVSAAPATSLRPQAVSSATLSTASSSAPVSRRIGLSAAAASQARSSSTTRATWLRQSASRGQFSVNQVSARVTSMKACAVCIMTPSVMAPAKNCGAQSSIGSTFATAM
jgi:hypothetical protein